MSNDIFVDSIKPSHLKGALRRIKSRINGLRNNSTQSLAVIPADATVRKVIDSMSLDALKLLKSEVESRIRLASKS